MPKVNQMPVWFMSLLMLSGMLSGMLVFGLTITATAFAESTINPESPEKKKWWENRIKQADIYYPHQAHMQSMTEEGDSCMLCHTFANNKIINEKQLKQLTTIANEPLKAICHDCHLDDVRAPWRCELCHTDKTTIWPDDHNYDYIHQHNEDARISEKACRSCHLDIAFCSDCHFRRSGGGNAKGQGLGADYHPLGYQSRHGIDARMMPSQCGRCHNSFYCSDCHRYKQ